MVGAHRFEEFSFPLGSQGDSAPRPESWGLVAGIVDPSGVLWRIVGPPDASAA